MEDAPLPEYITPKEITTESLEIKQDKNVYKLNIEIINQDITLTVLDEKEIMKEYETKLTLDKLKQINKIFLVLTSCQEFVDYIKALIENNKLSIKNLSENQICLEIMAEYFLKQNTIKIELIKKQVNFELIAQDLYKKILVLNENFKALEINYQNIINENKKIKEENESVKEENNRIKEENDSIRQEIKTIKEENKSIKEENKSIIEENKRIKEENNNIKQDIKTIKEERKIEGDRINNLEKIINSSKKDILQKQENTKDNDRINEKAKCEEMKKTDKKSKDFDDNKVTKNRKEPEKKNDKKKEIIENKIRTLIEKFENKLIDIFFNENSKNKINDNDDYNELKKISTSLLIQNMNIGEIFAFFLEKNKYNALDDIDNEKKAIINKKDDIFTALADIHNFFLLKEIDKHKINEFIKELREKIGITEEDMKDEEIIKEIKINKYNTKNTVHSILLKNNLF